MINLEATASATAAALIGDTPLNAFHGPIPQIGLSPISSTSFGGVTDVGFGSFLPTDEPTGLLSAHQDFALRNSVDPALFNDPSTSISAGLGLDQVWSPNNPSAYSLLSSGSSQTAVSIIHYTDLLAARTELATAQGHVNTINSQIQSLTTSIASNQTNFDSFSANYRNDSHSADTISNSITNFNGQTNNGTNPNQTALVVVDAALAGVLKIGAGSYYYTQGTTNSYLYNLLQNKLAFYDGSALADKIQADRLSTALNDERASLNTHNGELILAKVALSDAQTHLSIVHFDFIGEANFPQAFTDFIEGIYKPVLRNVTAFVIANNSGPGILAIPTVTQAQLLADPVLFGNTLELVFRGPNAQYIVSRIDANMGSATVVTGSAVTLPYINERNTFQTAINDYLNAHRYSAGAVLSGDPDLLLRFQTFLTNSSAPGLAAVDLTTIVNEYQTSHVSRGLRAFPSDTGTSEQNGIITVDALWDRPPVEKKPDFYSNFQAFRAFLGIFAPGSLVPGPDRSVPALDYVAAEIEADGPYSGFTSDVTRNLLSDAVSAMNQTVHDPYAAYKLGSIAAKAAAQLAIAGTRAALLYGGLALPQSLQAAEADVAAGAAALGYTPAQRNAILATAGIILAPVVTSTALAFVAANQKQAGQNVTVSSFQHVWPNIATSFSFATSGIALTNYASNAWPKVFQATKALGVPAGFGLSDVVSGGATIVSAVNEPPSTPTALKLAGGVVQFAGGLWGPAAAVLAWNNKISPKVGLAGTTFTAGLAFGLYLSSAIIYGVENRNELR